MSQHRGKQVVKLGSLLCSIQLFRDPYSSLVILPYPKNGFVLQGALSQMLKAAHCYYVCISAHREEGKTRICISHFSYSIVKFSITETHPTAKQTGKHHYQVGDPVTSQNSGALVTDRKREGLTLRSQQLLPQFAPLATQVYMCTLLPTCKGHSSHPKGDVIESHSVHAPSLKSRISLWCAVVLYIRPGHGSSYPENL